MRGQRFWIGDIEYAYEAPFDLDPAMWPAFYRGFERPQSIAGEDRLTWHVRLAGTGTAWPPGTPQFESESWSLWSGAAQRTIAFRGAPDTPPLWTVEMDVARGRADVRWDPRMEPTQRGGTLIANLLANSLDRFLAIYRLAQAGTGMLAHGAATDFAGRGYLLMGRSGRGKSTISRLLQDSALATVLTDERPIVRRTGGGDFWLCGTPWPSRAALTHAAIVPLRGLVFLEHGPRHELTSIDPAEALRRILTVITYPWHDVALFDPVVALSGHLVQSLPAWELRFRPEPSVASFLTAHLP